MKSTIKRLKSKNHMIISLDGKAFDKNQHSFMVKALERVGTYLNTVKAIHSKPTVIVNLNGEKLKVFLPKSATRQGCPLSPYFFKTVLGSLS